MPGKTARDGSRDGKGAEAYSTQCVFVVSQVRVIQRISGTKTAEEYFGFGAIFGAQNGAELAPEKHHFRA